MTSSTGKLQALVFTLVTTLSGAAQAASGIAFDGRILKPNGDPLSGANTQFKIQVRTPNAGDCLMFEEIQTQNLSTSNGYFSLTLNDGNGTRTDTSGYSVDQIFANRGMFNFSAASCASGVSYTPNLDDARKLVVYFKDETMAAFEALPSQTLNPVPYALETKNVAGFGIQNLMRVQEGDGTLTNITPLSNANYIALQALANGTSTVYEKAGKLGGVTMPTMTAGQSLGWNGSAWASVDPLVGVQAFAKTAMPACSAGAYIRNNGSGLFECTTPAAGGTGTVTSVMAGTGLTGGPITTSGTLALATLGAGGNGVKITYDTYGRVTAANSLAETDIPTLSMSGKVAGSAITSGTIGGSTAINTSGIITTTGTITTTGNVMAAGIRADAHVFHNAGSFVTMQNPAGSNYTLTLPGSMGSNGQVMSTNGSGQLLWTNPAMSPWTTSGSDAYYNTGNVGIGTMSPSEKLEIAGNLKVAGISKFGGGSSSAPSMTFTTSSNTGLYSSSAGTLDITAGGIQAASISNSGGFRVIRGTAVVYDPAGTTQVFPEGARGFQVQNLTLGNNVGAMMAYGSGTPGGYYQHAYTGIVTTPGTGNAPSYVIGTQNGLNSYSEKLRIDPVGNVGVGTTGPEGKFHVFNDSTSPTLLSETIVSNSGGNIQYFRKARGSNSARTPVLANDLLGGLAFNGWNGTDYGTNAGYIYVRAAEAFSPGAQGTNITLGTADLGTSTPVERVRIAPNGFVGIGTTAPAAHLDVNGFAKLKTNTVAPTTCSTPTKGVLALTDGAQICTCNGTTWINPMGSACNWAL